MGFDRLKYTKAYKVLYRTYRFLTGRCYPTAMIYQSLYCLCHPVYQFYRGNLIGLDAYIQRHRIKKEILVSKEKLTIFNNAVWGEEAQSSPKAVIESPEVYATELRNVFVYGGVNLMAVQEDIILPVFDDMTSGRWSYANRVLRMCTRKRGGIRHRKTSKSIDRALSLCGRVADNYYHFMVDILPKLALAEQQHLFAEYPVLVDDAVRKMPSMLEALELVNQSKREIIFVESVESVQVKKLACISEISRVPFDLLPGVRQIPEDFSISYQALACMRKYISEIVPKGEYDKIYLARYKSGRPRLQNDEEIAMLCEKSGFQIVFPEKMTFTDQMSLFRGAHFIIGCAGAAMTNTLFAEPGTEVYMIVPKVYQNSFWYTYMKNTGVQPLIVDATITHRARFVSADLFEADINEFPQILESIKKQDSSKSR